MGGVNLLDWLLGYYCSKIRSKKWYHQIFFHLVDMSVVSAWILWRMKNPKVPLACFKLAVTDLLCNCSTTRRSKVGRPSIRPEERRPAPKVNLPHQAIRSDQVGRWPVFKDSRTRYQNNKCTALSSVECNKCRVPLCLNKDPICFKVFHYWFFTVTYVDIIWFSTQYYRGGNLNFGTSKIQHWIFHVNIIYVNIMGFICWNYSWT